ncbi:phage tail protein [Deinococcus hopiensis]|uniref:Microcystin-dependent protein n=1 Tax=Deinococcus hopiensis KR-140 TaxID=695939 RepID=A0A1W1US36_9DEIO|nr:tail fiber protein [Deinococcus hopiensis]SMB83897.1 Microcystin-dependent protein [Deinococcus hopiensis KR-140]
MSEPFIGEIRPISFNFAPKGWAMCNGQLLPINQNQALFSILGTYYGGDGRTNFALPDLRGRMAVHAGLSVLGIRAGESFHTLTTAELPRHTHLLGASSRPATTPLPAGNLLAAPAQGERLYGTGPVDTALSPDAVSSFGGGQPHENRPPFLVLNYIIALQGIFPSRN